MDTSGGEGIVGESEAYAEISYNSKDVFTAGFGHFTEVGVGINIGTDTKALSGGLYTTAYTTIESR